MRLKFWKKDPVIEHTISEKDNDELTPWEMQFINDAKCPDCESGLLTGPSGGGSLNVYCADPDRCGSRFNLHLPGCADRISDRQPAVK